MRDPKQKHFRKNYYTMGVFFFMMLLAFKLSGHISGILCLTGMLIANPSIQIKQSKYRWWILLLLFILSLLFYPDINELKNKI
ncbi:MAG: hypothetical protein QM504_02325 [Pseudomonadota bacterium]